MLPSVNIQYETRRSSGVQPTGADREPNGSRTGAEREPNGSRREPTGAERSRGERSRQSAPIDCVYEANCFDNPSSASIRTYRNRPEPNCAEVERAPARGGGGGGGAAAPSAAAATAADDCGRKSQSVQIR